ncbi:hypothetical protein HK104_000828 [Borealophlyctis nickersoniae]|nr:hypothetical protein HK104_000828 [Borealophlyctis nickersoniae]
MSRNDEHVLEFIEKEKRILEGVKRMIGKIEEERLADEGMKRMIGKIEELEERLAKAEAGQILHRAEARVRRLEGRLEGRRAAEAALGLGKLEGRRTASAALGLDKDTDTEKSDSEFWDDFEKWGESLFGRPAAGVSSSDTVPTKRPNPTVANEKSNKKLKNANTDTCRLHQTATMSGNNFTLLTCDLLTYEANQVIAEERETFVETDRMNRLIRLKDGYSLFHLVPTEPFAVKPKGVLLGACRGYMKKGGFRFVFPYMKRIKRMDLSAETFRTLRKVFHPDRGVFSSDEYLRMDLAIKFVEDKLTSEDRKVAYSQIFFDYMLGRYDNVECITRLQRIAMYNFTLATMGRWRVPTIANTGSRVPTIQKRSNPTVANEKSNKKAKNEL